MPLMIWRLPHPVRGIVTFLAICVLGSAFGGFGMGLPELALLAILAGAVAVFAATRTTQDGGNRSS